MAVRTVEDIMSRDVTTVEPTENLSVAYDLMIEKNVRHLPVVDKKGNLLGILSDRDLIREGLLAERTPSSNPRDALRNRRVSEVMSSNPETVSPSDVLTEVGPELLDGSLSSLPVVEGTQLIGILTVTDLARAFLEGLER